MIEIIIISTLSVLLVVASVGLLYLRIARKDLAAQLIQSALTNVTLVDAMDRIKNEQELNENDGFVKFLSDSREWAFEYIELVQKSIKDFDKAMLSADDVEIALAYKALLNHLPKDGVNN